MPASHAAPASSSIAVVRRQFETWRALRRRGTRIPEPLWRSAVEQARAHGVAQTSQALRLDYYSLKQRVEGPAAIDDGLVEIVLPTAERTAECVVELDDDDGRRVRVTLRGGVAEIERLATSLLGRSR